ncbi:MAG: nicotinate-nucleotide adenylyltransferase [Thermodesulfobacteriota bacterium]
MTHIGIIGGTFNPVHYGHLRIAEEVRDACLIDKVVFIPSNIPPHKDGTALVASEDRLEMVRIATKDNPSFNVSDIEVTRKGNSYSIETLKELRKIYGEETDLSFILGIDAFLEIKTWKDYDKLFNLSNFIVTRRHGYNKEEIDDLLPIETADSISFIETTMLDISSTKIRERIKEGKSIRYLVPLEVEEHIMHKGLYK